MGKRKTILAPMKQLVWNTYIGKNERKGLCYCGSEIDTFNFECGHVLSVKEGGLNTLINLRPICGKCNKSMKSINMKKYYESHFSLNFNDIDLAQRKIIKDKPIYKIINIKSKDDDQIRFLELEGQICNINKKNKLGIQMVRKDISNINNNINYIHKSLLNSISHTYNKPDDNTLNYLNKCLNQKNMQIIMLEEKLKYQNNNKKKDYFTHYIVIIIMLFTLHLYRLIYY